MERKVELEVYADFITQAMEKARGELGIGRWTGHVDSELVGEIVDRELLESGLELQPEQKSKIKEEIITRLKNWVLEEYGRRTAQGPKFSDLVRKSINSSLGGEKNQ
ncbi:MAG: hypothetical protein OEY44_04780 [Candidatus Peregrinibacteria bacterium]|nr:hypothetical protein [Candidatus Peregrinibacteria bacterium]